MTDKETSLSEQEEFRRQKLEQLRELGVNPYPYQFDVDHTSKQIFAQPDLIKKKMMKIPPGFR